jgi:hypothetical protein
MRLSSCRRSRLYAYSTFSVCRCPVRFLASVIADYSPSRAFHVATLGRVRMVSPFQVCFGGSSVSPLETRIQPIQVSPLSLVRLLAHRACGASRSIPSHLTAFPTCYFPLRVSPPGRLDALRGLALYLLLFQSYRISAEAAHGGAKTFL